jgi:fructose-1-phosphate kinase PfkB-like protein
LQADVLKVAQSAQIIGVSGSLPVGSSPTAFVDFLSSLQRTGKPVWVDTSGAALKTAYGVPGVCLKVNQEEAGALVQQPIHDRTTAVQVAEQLVTQGHPTVVITLGAEGAILADENGAVWVCPPPVQSVSNVGSGDSLLGALAVALTLGHAPSEALRWGVAAGSANTLSIGGARFTLSDFQRILSQTRLMRLSL